MSLNAKVSHEERMQLDQINDSLEIANDLLLDLSEIARIESGNITPVIAPIAVNELFSLLCSEFNGLVDEHHIEFHCKSSDLYIASDIKLLSRIVQNFLSNAFRYVNTENKKGKVLLGCRRIKQHLCLQVLDNGPGIPEDKQQAVFEQFTQLGTTQNNGPKGLGLGLNIAQSLAELLGHQIILNSQAGHGCLFGVIVPIVDSPVEKPAEIHASSITLQGVGVLCIDNEPTVLAGMEQLLLSWKCQVFTASSAKKAHQILHKFEDQIDILLVDYQLDNNDKVIDTPINSSIDGISLIKELRSQSQYSKAAILITATTEDTLQERAEKANIGYLRKMIKPMKLRALMSALLTQQLTKNYRND